MKKPSFIFICVFVLASCDFWYPMSMDIKNQTDTPINFTFQRTNFINSKKCTTLDGEFMTEAVVDTTIMPYTTYNWDAQRRYPIPGSISKRKTLSYYAPLIYPYCSISSNNIEITLNNIESIQEFTDYLLRKKGRLGNKFWNNPQKYVKHARVQMSNK